MNRTRFLSSPLVTLLSPSPVASRKAQLLLSALCGLEEVPLTFSSSGDDLDKAFQSFIPGFSRQWDSIGSKCPVSGSLIHFCSLTSPNSKVDDKRHGSFSLLAITDVPTTTENGEAIIKFRTLFASHVQERASIIKMKSIRRPVSAEELLRTVARGGLPLLSLPQSVLEDNGESRRDDNQDAGLKEVVIPYYDYATYADGSTIFSNIGHARLKRPKVGVYEWTGSSTRIRPLPTAAEDQRLPPPSLIFHCENHEEVGVQQYGATTAKIGYGGNGNGQLMLLHKDLAGLDVRFCSQNGVSSTFSEAQESLLAASLNELQSTNTLLACGEKAKDDDRLGNSDCWAEFRANVKRPSGFLHRSSRKQRTAAKAPDIPFE